MSEYQDFDPTIEQKNKRWSHELSKLDEIVDRLGKHIDQDIRETVVAFKLNGFHTTASCEGHVEDRHGSLIKLAPYVIVDAPNEPKERFFGDNEIKKQIADKFGISTKEIEQDNFASTEYWDYIHKNQVKETDAYIAYRAENNELARRVSDLLTRFNEGGNTPEFSRIKIRRIGPSGKSKIAANHDFERVTPERVSEARKELAVQQTEMKALTEFLKQTYYSGNI